MNRLSDRALYSRERRVAGKRLFAVFTRISKIAPGTLATEPGHEKPFLMNIISQNSNPFVYLDVGIYV
jgi:hypothetical protein